MLTAIPQSFPIDLQIQICRYRCPFYLTDKRVVMAGIGGKNTYLWRIAIHRPTFSANMIGLILVFTYERHWKVQYDDTYGYIIIMYIHSCV